MMYDSDALRLLRMMTPAELVIFINLGGSIPRLRPDPPPEWYDPRAKVQEMRQAEYAKADKHWRWRRKNGRLKGAAYALDPERCEGRRKSA